MKATLKPALLGGCLGGLLDILYAVILWGVVLGGTPQKILQSVASGLIGKAAYEGGAGTAILGLALHFGIAICMALVYVMASRKLPLLTRRWLLSGVVYGVLLFAVMNYVVVPLSAIGWRPMTLMSGLRALLPHIVFVGPVIAWFAMRASRS